MFSQFEPESRLIDDPSDVSAGAHFVSNPQVPSVVTNPPVPADPLNNPSYPKRVHLGEKAHWESVLKACEEKLTTARQKLKVLGANAPERPAFEKLYAQMLGARDQVAEAARRLPGETGGLYEEDHHRLEEAVAALDRLVKRWGGR